MSFGTILYTWFHGELVGTDEFGNSYYRSKHINRWGREQRWCLFKGRVEASTVPPAWNAWLHHTANEPLTHLSTQMKFWQEGHAPNKTGTGEAYRPSGHVVQGGKRDRSTGDYEAWSPE